MHKDCLIEQHINSTYKSKNLDLFKRGINTILYVYGVAGSGKTYLANKLAQESNAEVIHLDDFDPVNGSTETYIIKFIASYKKWSDAFTNKVNLDEDNFFELWCDVEDFINNYAVTKKVIVEGVQLADFTIPKKASIILMTTTTDQIFANRKFRTKNEFNSDEYDKYSKLDKKKEKKDISDTQKVYTKKFTLSETLTVYKKYPIIINPEDNKKLADKLNELLDNFKYTTSKSFTRDNCGDFAWDLIYYLNKNGYNIGKPVHGRFKVDNLELVDKFDLTKQEIADFKSKGYSSFTNSNIIEYIKDNNINLKEFYYIPHYWVEIDNLILDPSWKMFDKAIDTNKKSRYIK